MSLGQLLEVIKKQNKIKPRMYSSRMRTVRCSGRLVEGGGEMVVSA